MNTNAPTPHDLQHTAWREYDFAGRVYRISSPITIWAGTTTHRILDAENIVHCVPAPGVNGCVLRWMAKPGEPNVKF